MRTTSEEEEDIGINLSPLIDCVFLLLIFFLVTTMIKKTEKQIPVRLPESHSSLTQKSRDDVVVLSLDKLGNIRLGRLNKENGEMEYRYLRQTISTFLSEHRESERQDWPLRIDATAETPFQLVVNLLDQCQDQGIQNVGVRLKEDPR